MTTAPHAQPLRAEDEVARICQELIRLDTSNYGDGSGPGERVAAEYVAGLLSDVGLEPELFRPLQAGADDPYFTEFERTIIRATEELVNDRLIGEANWRALSAEWSNQQLLDFMFTVGAYVLTAGVMRSTGVEREPELLELAEKYGAPD